MAVTLEALTGSRVADVLPDLARLRIEVFRDWPYLYDGTLAYEQSYLAKFVAARDTLIVVAYDNGRAVGASTASPMEGHVDAFASTFRRAGFDPEAVYYFGESVLLPAYRGQGIGHAFFDRREVMARQLGAFTHTAFCTVVRPPDHPLRPASYRPLDGFWQKRNYHCVDGLTASLRWKDIDQPAETAKPMQFWTRKL